MLSSLFFHLTSLVSQVGFQTISTLYTLHIASASMPLFLSFQPLMTVTKSLVKFNSLPFLCLLLTGECGCSHSSSSRSSSTALTNMHLISQVAIQPPAYPWHSSHIPMKDYAELSYIYGWYIIMLVLLSFQLYFIMDLPWPRLLWPQRLFHSSLLATMFSHVFYTYLLHILLTASSVYFQEDSDQNNDSNIYLEISRILEKDIDKGVSCLNCEGIRIIEIEAYLNLEN